VIRAFGDGFGVTDKIVCPTGSLWLGSEGEVGK